MENGESATSGDGTTKPQAVSFMIGFDERPSKQLPKRKAHVLAQHQRGRVRAKEMTEEDLAEKQRRAEERRKKLTEEKLERIRQREMEALALAQSMDPLVHQMAEKKGKEEKKSGQQLKCETIQAAKRVVDSNLQVARELESQEQAV